MAATTGVMADFARMPTSRKVLVFAVIGIVLGFLYWRFVYTPLSEEVEANRSEIQANVKTKKTNEDDIKAYALLRTEMADIEERLQNNQKALPTEAEVPAFFETLERKVRESGVEILKWQKRSEEPVETFVKVPVDIQISGTFLQLKRFFASLVQQDVAIANAAGTGQTVQQERIVSIENLALSKPEVRNREIFLTAKFTAVTFRQEDKVVDPGAKSTKPDAKGKAAPTPATKPAAPAAPGPAAPAMPSATTPAGAKARVEESIEKGTGSARLGGGL